jgi:hypothetical protein
MTRRILLFGTLGLLGLLIFHTPFEAGEKEEMDLLAEGLKAFKDPYGDWQEVANVNLDPTNPRKLEAKPGKGVWYNGPKGNARNLFTREKFGDVAVHLEFLVPKGSNSGIKFHGHYEIQIMDSFGVKNPGGHDCGGIYPRAELKPKYHHIDKGIPPKVNACKAPGEWQTLDITFVAPRFDEKGKKTTNARLAKVLLNGQVIHDNQELLTPTGDRWPNPEMSEGPIMLQADHGPVAFRNIKLRKIQK